MFRFHIVYKLKGDVVPVKTANHEGEEVLITRKNHAVTVDAVDMISALESFTENLKNEGKNPENFDINLCYRVSEGKIVA